MTLRKGAPQAGSDVGIALNYPVAFYGLAVSVRLGLETRIGNHHDAALWSL